MIQAQDDEGFIVGSLLFSGQMFPIISWIQLFSNSVASCTVSIRSEFAGSKGLWR